MRSFCFVIMQVQPKQMPVTGAPQFVDGGQYMPSVIPVQSINNNPPQPVIHVHHQPVSSAMQGREQNPSVYQKLSSRVPESSRDVTDVILKKEEAMAPFQKKRSGHVPGMSKDLGSIDRIY